MASYEEILAGGAVTSVALQVGKGLGFLELASYVETRWPNLSVAETQALVSLAIDAHNAGTAIQASPGDAPQPLGSVPVNPFVDDGDMAGTREQVAIEISVPDPLGGPPINYLVIVPSTGLESPNELLQMALNDLCNRAGMSPGDFPGVDCTNVVVFDYEILSAIRAF